jgi:hypothetical protein
MQTHDMPDSITVYYTQEYPPSGGSQSPSYSSPKKIKVKNPQDTFRGIVKGNWKRKIEKNYKPRFY